MEKYEQMVKQIEDTTGWSIANKDEIKDKESAIRIFRQHIQWVRSHAEDVTGIAEGLLMEAGLYDM